MNKYVTRGKTGVVWQTLLVACCWYSVPVIQAAPQPQPGVVKPVPKPGAVKPKPEPAVAKPKPVTKSRQEITLNFTDADIRTVIEAVAERTGKNFIIDPRVKGKVTVISKRPIKDKELYEVLLSVLKIHGYAAIPGRNAIKIVPEVNAKQDAIDTVTGRIHNPGDEFVTQVLEVKHVDAAQLVPILRPLVPQRGHLAAYPDSNVLIISDSAANIERIATIIQRIDQATGEEIEVIPLQHASATEVVRVITQLEGHDAKSKANRSQIIADERTNSILLGGAVASRVRIRALIGHLDTPMDVGGHTHVVYLKNAVAKDLVPVLTGVSKSVVAGKGTKSVAASTSGNITIQADENTNALVINAPPDIFRSLRTVIQKLDIRRAQVMVEAVIAEVTTETTQELGIQWAFDGSANNRPIGIIGFGGSPGAVANLLDADLTNPPAISNGLNLGVGKFSSTNKIGALINMLDSNSSNNILSTPNLVTLDNQEAEIVVGQNVPFLTGSYTSTGSGSGATNPFTTVQRQDVGLTLRIKPQINEGNAVKMDIEHEVSGIAESASGGVDLITNKRSIKTSVMVEDDQILVLGGLIEDSLLESEEKVPVLGDIPILGWFFRYKTTKKAKTNHMVFLHPTILKDAAFNAKVTNDKYQYLRNQQLAARERNIGLMSEDAAPLLPDIKDFLILPAPYKGKGGNVTPDLSSPPATREGQ